MGGHCQNIGAGKKVYHSLGVAPGASEPMGRERVYYQTLVAHWPLASLSLTDDMWATTKQGRGSGNANMSFKH